MWNVVYTNIIANVNKCFGAQCTEVRCGKRINSGELMQDAQIAAN